MATHDLTKLYEGANLAGATENVIYLPIVRAATLNAVKLKTKTAQTGAAVFELYKNGVLVTGADVTIANGSETGQTTGLNVQLADGDEITLKLASGNVAAPLALTLVVDDGQSVGGSTADVQIFTASGTWTKPAGAKMVEIIMIGGGGGGGSGRKGAAGTQRGGGGAGSGAAGAYHSLPASILGATETVTVGAGGAGGAAQTVNSVSGTAGSDGGSSSFGNWMKALGGNAGSGGTGVAGSGGAAPPSFQYPNSTAGSAGGGTQTAQSPGISNFMPSGGAGGGHISTGNAASPGAGCSALGATLTTSGYGATIPATAPGANGANAPTNSPQGGNGGGGGTGSTTGNGGTGGTGGLYGAGGGGGGAAANDVGNSGAGGTGGNGIVIVVTYF